MESTIKWQTGEPKEKGEYILSLKNGKIVFDEYVPFTTKDGEIYDDWKTYYEEDIVGWCKTSDISPCTDEESDEADWYLMDPETFWLRFTMD